MPNSLIFVVILAVWAAYLIQHWIRRRDHVATAKSVDRFSEAMRVLERRQNAPRAQHAPRADITTPTPRSYAVSLTRPAHPDVVVKRARHGAAEPEPRRARRRLPRPSAATLRAVLLVVGVLALAAGITLWVMGIFPWWSAAAGATGLLLALTFVRLSVGRQRRRAASPVRPHLDRKAPQHDRMAAPHHDRMAAPHHDRTRRAEPDSPTGRAGRRPKARPDARKSRTAARRTAAVDGADRAGVVEQAQPQMVTAASATPAVTEARDHFFDVEAQHRTSVAGAAAGDPEVGVVAEGLSEDPRSTTAAEAAPGSWAPVPVPPPTYTLKAKAVRPASSTSGPATGRVEDLPFDGNALAFDEEFEDLPPVHSVG